MSLHVFIENEFSSINDFRVFGAANIPVEMEWPRDSEGRAMLLLLSLPLCEFPKYASMDRDLICSVFISYDPVNCDHLYSGILGPEEGGCKFVISREGASKLKKRRVIEPAKKAFLRKDNECEGAYWLQDEIEIKGMEYQFQISAVTIFQAFPQLESVFGDEEYYFFVGTHENGVLDGRVIVQMT